MNSVFVETFSKRQKNSRRFVPSKGKGKTSAERRALISRDVTDSDSDDEEITLLDIRRVRKNESNNSLRQIKKPSSENPHSNGDVERRDPFPHCDICYYDIEPGDTLESISIKYQCSVSDIKRANNLINHQEFHALTRLKIPVKKHSLLTEILSTDAKPHTEKNTPTTIENSDTSRLEKEETDCDIRTISIGIGGRSPSPQDSAAFFRRMDQDLVQIMLCTNSKKESLEAAAVALTTKQIRPLVKDPYNTVDCGIQWNYLVVFVIVFVVVVPAGVALYLYFRSEHHDGGSELGKS